MVFKNSKCETFVIKSWETAYLSGLTKKVRIWKSGQGNITSFQMIPKECRENMKTHREVWPFSPLSTTPLWKTSWASELYYDFFLSHTFYQLSRKSNPVFKMTLLELTCRRDKNTKVRHENYA